MVFLAGDSQICPGIRVVLTPGHTLWHQSIVLDTGDETLCYLGDLIPTTHHLRPIYILAYDLYPRHTFVNKQKLMDQAFRENWILVWSHDLETPWAVIGQNDQGAYVPVLL